MSQDSARRDAVDRYMGDRFASAKAGAARGRLMSANANGRQSAVQTPQTPQTPPLKTLASDVSERFEHLELDMPVSLPQPEPLLLPEPEPLPEPVLELAVQTITLPPVKWPEVARDNPATREQLQKLLEMAKREELPKRSRICLPTGRMADDWNVAVRGSIQSCAHARKTGNTAWMNYELVDLDHLSFQVRVRGLGNPNRASETETAQAMRTEAR